MSGLGVYLSAYEDLQFDRPVGMSVGPIPWSSIIKWCHLHDVYDINEIDVFVRHIRTLERVDHEIQERKREK